MTATAERYETPLRDRGRLTDLPGRKFTAPRPDPFTGTWVDGGQVVSPAPAPRTYWVIMPGGEWRIYRSNDLICQQSLFEEAP